MVLSLYLLASKIPLRDFSKDPPSTLMIPGFLYRGQCRRTRRRPIPYASLRRQISTALICPFEAGQPRADEVATGTNVMVGNQMPLRYSVPVGLLKIPSVEAVPWLSWTPFCDAVPEQAGDRSYSCFSLNAQSADRRSSARNHGPGPDAVQSNVCRL